MHGVEIERKSESTGEGHFGRGDEHSALAAVVGRSNQSRRDGRGHRSGGPGPRLEVEFRKCPVLLADRIQVHELGPTHRRGRVADQHQPRTRLLGIHGDAPPDVIDDAEAGDQEGRRNADGSTVVRRELVVEGILAGDEGRPVGECCIPAALRRAHELSHALLVVAAGPAEVVEHRDPLRIGADADQIPNALVESRDRHAPGIVLQSGGEAIGHRQAAGGTRHGEENRRVGGAVPVGADLGADHAPALHLVVVLFDDAALGGDVGVRKQSLQCDVDRGRRDIRRRPGRFHRLPPGDPDPIRQSVVQQGHGQSPELHIVPVQDQFAVGRTEGSQHAQLDVVCVADLLQGGQPFLRNRHHHSFLRLGDPDLGGRQPLVLQRSRLQLHRRTELLPHLAHRTGESAGAAVGDGAVETAARRIPRLHDRVEHLLLRHRIADLDGVRELVDVGVRQLGGRERRAVDAVPTRPAAQSDDQIARPGITRHPVAGHHPHASAVDEWIADVVVVEPHGAVDGGNAHPVAVVADARDDLGQDAAGVQTTRGKRTIRVRRPGVEMSDAEDIAGRDRARRQAGADDVPDAATDAGCGTAVRLQGGRMVVRLDLEADRVLLVEGDDARIVHEHGQTPVDSVRHQFLGRRGDGRTKQVVDSDHLLADDLMTEPIEITGQRPVVFDPCLECLVHAVLGPGLRERLQFDLARITTHGAVGFLQGLHLVETQEEVGFARKSLQRLVVELQERDRPDLGFPIVPRLELLGVVRSVVDIVNQGVGETSFGKRAGLSLIETIHIETAAGPDRDVDTQQAPHSEFHGLRLGIHHPGLGMDLDQRIGAGLGCTDHRPFGYGMAQQFVRDPTNRIGVEFTLDQVDGGGLYGLGLRVQRCRASRLAGGCTAWISSITAGAYLDAMNGHDGLHPELGREYRSHVVSATTSSFIPTLNGKAIAAFILRMLRVPANPVGRDPMHVAQFVQSLPQVLVEHRLLLRRLPAIGQPAIQPGCEAVDHVLAVRVDLDTRRLADAA